MSIVILDAMEKENIISSALKGISEEKREEVSVFKLNNMNILPCRCCGACTYKSPGKCVVEDDMHEILKAIAKCQVLVLLTPIRFGGYSSCLKKAVDKFMNLCLPLYTVKYGHLLHPPRYGSKSLLGIGVCEGNLDEQKKSFRKLVENNALNLQYTHKTLIIKPSDNAKEIKYEIGNILKEVSWQ